MRLLSSESDSDSRTTHALEAPPDLLARCQGIGYSILQDWPLSWTWPEGSRELPVRPS